LQQKANVEYCLSLNSNRLLSIVHFLNWEYESYADEEALKSSFLRLLSIIYCFTVMKALPATYQYRSSESFPVRWP